MRDPHRLPLVQPENRNHLFLGEDDSECQYVLRHDTTSQPLSDLSCTLSRSRGKRQDHSERPDLLGGLRLCNSSAEDA